MRQHAAQRFDADALERPAGGAAALRPFRPPELYRQRLAGYPASQDSWFTFHAPNDASEPSAAVLVRAMPDRAAMLVSLSRDPSLPLSAIVPPLASALRRAGHQRLSIFTLAGSHLAQELTRAGFRRRDNDVCIMARALTDAGHEALRAATSWEITELDCDR
jgi:hypothetical protein